MTEENKSLKINSKLQRKLVYLYLAFKQQERTFMFNDIEIYESTC